MDKLLKFCAPNQPPRSGAQTGELKQVFDKLKQMCYIRGKKTGNSGATVRREGTK